MNIFSDLKLLIITLSVFSSLNLALGIAYDHIRPGQLGGFDNTSIVALLPDELLNVLNRYNALTEHFGTMLCEFLGTLSNSLMTSILALF